MIDIEVAVASATYPVRIEPGLLAQIGSLAESVHAGRRALLVIDANVLDHARVLRESFSQAWTLSTHTFEATESNKRLDSIGHIMHSALEAGLDRGSLLIAVGGGVTGDVGGYAAASFMRGIDLIHVPTTLLAMVDASIGGKTGVNLPLPHGGGVGKNLAGAFWQPRGVFIDPLVLKTLPERERRCGLAECIKHGIISDAGLLDLIEATLPALLAAEPDAIQTLVQRAVEVKVLVIQADERELGQRAGLNLGHTFAHAIEPIPELDLHHGEAVAIGLIAAATLACHRGTVPPAVVDRTRSLIELVGLPTRISQALPVGRLVSAMRFDKKAHEGRLRLVLPTLEGVEVIDNATEAELEAAWRAVGATAGD